MLAKSAGAKSVIHLHVKVDDWLRRNVKWAMREADGLLGVSRFVAESAVNKGYDKEKAFYVLNALDSNLWNPDTDGSCIREEFNIAKDNVVMTICAVICSWKGHPELIEAMPLVVKEVPNIKLMIVGVDEPRRDDFSPPLSPILKSRAKELGVQDNVIFTGFRRDVEKILAASDFFAMPSFEEPCAVAYLEAMAMKLPIVALNQGGGAPEVIKHGQMGLLSDYKNIEQLAENIIILAKDTEMRKRMGEYNRKRLVEYYNPNRFATEAGDVFKHILGLGKTKQVISET
jgi:glycosyltransferase involved in cell wall biosynthesis